MKFPRLGSGLNSHVTNLIWTYYISALHCISVKLQHDTTGWCLRGDCFGIVSLFRGDNLLDDIGINWKSSNFKFGEDELIVEFDLEGSFSAASHVTSASGVSPRISA